MGSKLGLIGFVFSRSGKTYIDIILVCIRSCAYFSVLEIGFVLHIYTRLGGSGVVGVKLGLIGFVFQTCTKP